MVRKCVILLFIMLVVVICIIKCRWFGSSLPYRFISACGKWKRKICLVNQWSNPIDKKIAKENLTIIHDVFTQNNIFFWLSEGTALGFFRNNDIIDWDDDVDLGIFYEDKITFVDVAVPQLEKYGFVVTQGFNNFYSLERKGVDVDIDITGDDIMSVALMDDGYKLMPHLQEFNKYVINNREFNLPKIDYIVRLYGDDWYIPKQGMAGKPFNWRAVRSVISGY